MERSFESLYTELQKETGDNSAGKLILFKRWLNDGLGIFRHRLKIRDSEQVRLQSAVLDQKQYQRPEDASRILDIAFNDGSSSWPLKEEIDNAKWTRMHYTSISGKPTHYHLVGEDLYEVYPKPDGNYSAASDQGFTLNCRIKQRPMSAAEYSTGNASVSASGRVITGAGGATFTAAMVGRFFKFADSAVGGNGVWYRISGYTDATHITLENYYDDTAVSNQSYIIAELPELPPDLHSVLYDYAYWRWLLGGRELAAAREFKAIWKDALDNYQPMEDTEGQVYGPTRMPALDDNFLQVEDTVL